MNLPVPATPLEAQAQAVACKRVADALAAPTFRQVMQVQGKANVAMSVVAVLTRGMEYFSASRRLSPEQVNLFAEEMIDHYQHESLADLHVFLRQAALGEFDEGKTYGALDPPQLLGWFKRYLAAKADERERAAKREEDEFEQDMKSTIGQIPGLGSAVHAFVVDAKERSELVRKANRLTHLSKHLPTMTDDALREAWKVYRAADERSLIYAEAQRRGLAQKAIEDAVSRIATSGNDQVQLHASAR